MKTKTSIVHSAGGVVLREGLRGLKVLLIATHDHQRWSLPKGRLKIGEPSPAAALREVAEETGIRARILVPLETVEYWFYASRHHRMHKFVEYFLMEYEAGTPIPQVREVDAVRWCSVAEACERATYPNDRRILLLARERWKERLNINQ
ncbi:MAG: NUDIX hydrolase [Ardenticatenaceae bacterium]